MEVVTPSGQWGNDMGLLMRDDFLGSERQKGS